MGGNGGNGGNGDVVWPDRDGGTSTALPAVVRTGRIIFQSESGEACCVALNPSVLSGDTGAGLAVLDDLPAGPATVSVSGFATDFAPGVPDITTTCSASPASAVSPCDPVRVAPAAFSSDPLPVNILAGVQTNLGQVAMKALPFLFDFKPIQDEQTREPVGFDFTVVDAITGISRTSVGLEVRFEVEDNTVVVTPTTSRTPERPSFRLLSKRIPIQLSACADDSGTPCTEGGFGLVGFTATGQGVNMPSGVVEARIMAANEDNPPQPLDFSYPFTILPTPTRESGS
jgi:hypothetical protein